MKRSDSWIKDVSPVDGLDDTLGTWSDPIVEFMARRGIPLTRRNYLDLAYTKGDEPEELGAELESMLPPEVRDDE